MAGTGRDFIFRWGGVVIPGIRAKGLTINGSAIDITNDDSLGWRTNLDTPGERSVDFSIEGVVDDDTFISDLIGGTVQKAWEAEWENGLILSGTGNLVGTGRAHPYNDAMTFDASIQSSGEVDITAGT